MGDVRMKIIPTEKPVTCAGKNSKCDTCRIGPNGSKFCEGCNGQCGPHGRSQMWKCHQTCDKCGGGVAAMNTVMAVCCKSPWADLHLDRVERESYNWTKRPVISFKQRGIIVTQGSPGKVRDPYPPETECIAVNLRHVWSKRGWYSRDMRDYLRLPAKTKLLLLTMTHDDVLERAWDAKLHEEDWGSVGFDYWQPLHFSMYSFDARMNQYFQWRRSLIATEASKAWFTTYAPDLLSRKTHPILKEMSASIPQVMFNAQFDKTPDALRTYMRSLVHDDKLHPKTVPFWFVGQITPSRIRLFRQLLPGRELYFLATLPWLAGHKGMAFEPTGKTRYSSLPKEELLLSNQRVFAELVNNAVTMRK